MSSAQQCAKTIQDMMECPICCLRFERPLQLSCGHSFCGNCVDRLVADARNARLEEEDFIFHPLGQAARPVAADVNRGVERLNQNREEAERARLVPNLFGLEVFPHRQHVAHNANAYEHNERLHFRRFNFMANAEYTIRCPECRRPTNVPPDGLPVNYRLQEVLARLTDISTRADSADTRATHTTEASGSGLRRCLACGDILVQSIYFVCLTCVGDNMRQLCSLCCLRNHGGHEIREEHLITENDIESAKDAVSEATSRGYMAVDNAFYELNVVTDAMQDLLRERTQPILEAFSGVADSMKIELLYSHEQLNVKVEKAREMCGKLETLPYAIKNVMEEFLNRITTVVRESIGDFTVVEGVFENINPGNALSGNNNGEAMESSFFNPVPSWSPVSFGPIGEERPPRNSRMMRKHSDPNRKRARVVRLRSRLGKYTCDLRALQADRERLELLRDQHRNRLHDGDDGRFARATLSPAAVLGNFLMTPERTRAPPRISVTPLPLPRRIARSDGSRQEPIEGNLSAERVRETSCAANQNNANGSVVAVSQTSPDLNENNVDESVEIVSEVPSAVNDLEQRAKQLLITAKHQAMMAFETGVASNLEHYGPPTEEVAQNNVRNKNKRGKGPLGATDEGSAINKPAKSSEGLPVSPESTPRRERVVKRTRSAMDPGPSWFCGAPLNNMSSDADDSEGD